MIKIFSKKVEEKRPECESFKLTTKCESCKCLIESLDAYCVKNHYGYEHYCLRCKPPYDEIEGFPVPKGYYKNHFPVDKFGEPIGYIKKK